MTDLAGPEEDDVTAVAKRLAQRVARERILKPEDVENAIAERFGDDWAHSDANADHDLSARVVAEFQRLTPDAVWHGADHTWRQEPAEAVEE